MLKRALLIMAMGGTLISTSAHADSLITDIDTDDIWTVYSQFWDGDDTNSCELNNGSKKAEENWVEALLGLEYDNPSLNLIKKEIVAENKTVQVNYDPGFAWDYAVVKIGNKWFAFADDGDDDLLSFDLTDQSFNNAMGHQSFYSFDYVPKEVPEPTTLMLMGAGIAVLGACRRRRR